MNPYLTDAFPEWVFQAAFPFSFAWDDSMQIIGIGRSLQRLVPEASPGTTVHGLFHWRRPLGNFTAGWLEQHENTLLLLEVRQTELMLRGQVIADSKSGTWLFIGTPWIRSPEHLDEMGLNLSDFAPYDSSIDMLYMVQALKTSNREMRDLNERLKMQGAELRAARDHAETANRAKSDFLAMISHEIRTPMNGVIGMNSLLRDTPLTAHQTGMLDAAIQSSRALVAIIDDILDFSKVESGLVTLRSECVDIDELLESVVNIFTLEAAIRNLEIIMLIDPGVPGRIVGDFGRLRQILVNLVGNAVKFTEKGSIVIRILLVGHCLEFSIKDTGIGLRKEDVVRLFKPFSQIDTSATRQHGGTGLGLSICKKLIDLMGGEIGVEGGPDGSLFWFRIDCIPPAPDSVIDQPRLQIDQLIWIADPSELRRESLRHALAIHLPDIEEIHSLDVFVRMMKDSVNPPDLVFIHHEWISESIMRDFPLCSSGSGKPSPRVILINGTGRDVEGLPTLSHPLSRRQIRNLAFPNDAERKEENIPASRPVSLGLKVMVAEDNPVNAMLVTMLLDKFGCTWVCAHNGREAVEKFHEQHFDAILMDCQMPVMDGCEAARKIREIEKNLYHTNGSCLIVAMTANAIYGERERCIESGMDGYISKPFEAESLEQILKSIQCSSKSNNPRNQ